MVFRELSERACAEQVFEASQNLLAGILNSSPDGIMALKAVRDEQGNIVDFVWLLVNPRAEELLGRSAGDLTGKRLLAEMSGLWPADLFEACVDVVDTGTPYRDELCYDRDGIQEWYQVVAVKLDDGLGVTFRDVTETKRIDEAVRRREEQLRRAQAVAHLGSWEWDMQTGELSWSDELYRIHGLEPGGGITFRAFVGLLHPDDRERVLRVIEEARQSHRPFTLYHRIVRPDGEERILRGEGEVFVDAAGNALKMYGIGQDVTEWKTAEEDLRKSEARYRLLAENVTDLIMRSTPKGVITYASPSSKTLLGYAPDKLVGQSMFALVHPEDEPLVQAMHARLVEQPEIRAFQFRLRTRRGGYVWVETTARAVRREESGEAVEITSVTRDVTVRRQAEERMRLLEACVSASLDGITIADCTRPDYPIMYVSPGFTRITGYATEEVLGRNGRFLQQRADGSMDRDQPALEEVRAALETGTQCRVTLRNYRKDGTLFWNELTLYPLRDGRGRLTHYVGVQRDVTERREAEEQLARINTTLEQRNRELQEFAYVASHDLQEPLRKIRAFSDLMLEDYGRDVDEMGRYYLERMHDAATRMFGLISDLLTYSRITTRDQSFEEVDLNRIVADVLSDLEVQIAESGAKVTVAELPTIEGDATQMRQLLQNFVSNALKFHKPNENPVVAIRAAIERRKTRKGQKQEICRLEVSDQGIGFDERYLDRIFTPFQRLHGRGEYAGTGMGLAICRRIVERHHGSITAKSRPGEGATFIVRIPVHRPQGKEDNESA